MSDQPEITTAVGTQLLFENDRVRVWDLRLEPGETMPTHRHECDYLYVVIGDGELQRVDPDGTRAPVVQRRDGEVVFHAVRNEYTHAAHNAGQSPWRNIVVELKEPNR
jgi:quercetin dioxygenase-like cupin family protein